MRWLFTAILSSVVVGQTLTPAETAELARAAKDPFDLARFIDTHPAPGWDTEVKSRTLIVAPNYQQRDFEACKSKLLTLKAPEQVIVVIECAFIKDFVRYTHQSNGSWQAEGTAGTGPREPTEYKLDRVSGTTFLRVKSELDHGSNVHAEGERWYDLVRPGFEPAFTLMTEVWDDRWNTGIGRKVSTIVAERSDEVRATLRFEFYNQDVTIALWSPTVVYSRVQPGGPYRCRSLDPIAACRDLDKLTATGETETPPEEYLIRFALPGLKKIATGPDDETKQWLREYIAARTDTPEVRELRALLQ
jgi:hypothetical protein